MDNAHFKCPFCGDYWNDEQSFRAHVGWKHEHLMQGDLQRFRAPTYGLGSDNGEEFEHHARIERTKRGW